MNTALNLKQNAKKVAQQIANEPLEILKNASRQVMASPENVNAKNGNDKVNQGENSEMSKEEQEYKKQLAEQEGRKLQALESELLEITRQKKFNEILLKIQSGEDVSVESFQELSSEQRDVLKAHLQTMQSKKEQERLSQSDSLPEPQAKRGRQMGGMGRKQSAQKQTTRVEKPVPPSG